VYVVVCGGQNIKHKELADMEDIGRCVMGGLWVVWCVTCAYVVVCGGQNIKHKELADVEDIGRCARWKLCVIHDAGFVNASMLKGTNM
jgi:hypothetical protein